ncbi:MAG: hypothetical protein NTV74_07335 [Euryarchaeota archaeon]|nr:hypothetical protein [Euryarchaeota archaeon]
MKNKILVLGIMGMFLLTTVVSAAPIANKYNFDSKKSKEDLHQLTNNKFIANLDDFIEVDKNANECYQYDARWHNWSDHGMECDNYWSPTDNDYIYYLLDVPQNTPDSILIGAEFKADGVPWNGGPDIDALNPATGMWVTIKQGMGKPSTLTWEWYTISKEYINDFDTVAISILCAAGGHVWLDEVGVKYTPPPTPVPDLKCIGSLGWTDVSPGSTVTGSFTVKNIGEQDSNLNWEVSEWPDWGTWTFSPQSGVNLPKDGTASVQVTVVAPDQGDQQFNGTVKVVNADDSDDFEIISVSLATPYSQQNIQSQQSSPQVNPSPNQQNSPLFYDLVMRQQTTK